MPNISKRTSGRRLVIAAVLFAGCGTVTADPTDGGSGGHGGAAGIVGTPRGGAGGAAAGAGGGVATGGIVGSGGVGSSSGGAVGTGGIVATGGIGGGAVSCGANKLCSDGVCSSEDGDPKHCGLSCSACPSSQGCHQGACVSSCASGTLCPDGTCSGPTNTADCGACGTACGAGSSCVSGTCGCSVAGQQLCNGTCIDVTANTSNCGSCGHACTSGQACSNGTCITASTTGTGGSSGSLPACGGNFNGYTGSCGKTDSAGRVCETCQWNPGPSDAPCTFASGSAVCVDSCASCP